MSDNANELAEAITVVTEPERPKAILIFENPGEIDPRLITVMGTNLKTSSSTPIGTFGTGLKYAIAGILRLGGTVFISSGLVEHSFAAYPEAIQDKTFGFIKMFTTSEPTQAADPGQTLGFTTELGKNWAPWMLYRELWSNMKDEGGTDVTFVQPDTYGRYILPAPTPGITRVIVQCDEVSSCFSTESDFLLSTKPIWTNTDLEIHPARTDGAVFYRGIRVATVKQKSSEYTYNILHPERLTEDRTIDLWTCSYRIVQSLSNLDDQLVAETILLAKDSIFEATFTFEYSTAFSFVMRDAIKFHKYNKHLNESARKRSRHLYVYDSMPVAIPRTPEVQKKISRYLELLSLFNINIPWTEIRPCKKSHRDDDSIIFYEDVLWVTEEVLASDDWLLQLLARRHDGQSFNAFREEKDLLFIMNMARPTLPVLEEYFANIAKEALEEEVTAAEETFLQPVEATSSSEIPF
jgi:hypothetical protein